VCISLLFQNVPILTARHVSNLKHSIYVPNLAGVPNAPKIEQCLMGCCVNLARVTPAIFLAVTCQIMNSYCGGMTIMLTVSASLPRLPLLTSRLKVRVVLSRTPGEVKVGCTEVVPFKVTSGPEVWVHEYARA
jgi:hypothetical protein